MLILAYDDDFLPRASLSPPQPRGRGHRRVSSFCCGGISISPKSLINDLSRKSFSYDVLPPIPLKLTICKLDGSSFEIQVPKTATVGELKQAVEEVFSNMQRKGHKISWAHVWGHFCLCYDGWKLLTDSEYLSSYLINDGDQLHFVHHKSVSKNLFRKQSKEKLFTSEQQKMMSSCKSDNRIKRENNVEKDEAVNNYGSSPIQYGSNDISAITTSYEYKFAQILGRWFSYQRIGRSKQRKKACDFSSKVADGFSGSFRNLMRFCSSNKVNSQRDA